MRIALPLAALVAAGISASSSAIEYGQRIELEKGMKGIPASMPTSLVAILGAPKSWNGKLVDVAGWIRYDLHGSRLFLSSEWCRHYVAEYGIGVDLQGVPGAGHDWERILQPHCRFARVEGRLQMFEPDKPKPNTLIMRPTPGVLHANAVRLDD